MWEAFVLSKTPAFFSPLPFETSRCYEVCHKQSAIHLLAMGCRFKSKVAYTSSGYLCYTSLQVRSDAEVMCKVLSMIDIMFDWAWGLNVQYMAHVNLKLGLLSSAFTVSRESCKPICVCTHVQYIRVLGKPQSAKHLQLFFFLFFSQ